MSYATHGSLDDALKRVHYDVPGFLKPLSLALIAAGAAGFAAALMTDADTAWRAYLQNFIFWMGLAQGAVMWSVISRIVNANWSRTQMRLWEGAGFFLPVAFVLYIGLVIGGYTSHIYEWVHHPIHHKEVWLAPGFVFARGFVWLAVMFGVTAVYLYNSFKADVRVLKGTPHAPALFQRLFANASGSDDEWQTTQRKLVRLSPAMVIVYAICMSMFAFDLVMSLEPYWYSTMFGGWIFMGNMYIALAFGAVVAAMVRKRGLLESYIGKYELWDVGKLLFALSMFWTYLMWSQYLPIWYGNIPEETGFVIKRTMGAYREWSFAILALCWLIPWWILLPKASKQKPAILAFAAMIALVGMWLERWTIVAPSQFDHAPVAAADAVFPGWIEVVTALLFAGLFVASYRVFLKGMPILAVGDPIFKDVVEHGGAHKGH